MSDEGVLLEEDEDIKTCPGAIECIINNTTVMEVISNEFELLGSVIIDGFNKLIDKIQKQLKDLDIDVPDDDRKSIMYILKLMLLTYDNDEIVVKSLET